MSAKKVTEKSKTVSLLTFLSPETAKEKRKKKSTIKRESRRKIEDIKTNFMDRSYIEVYSARKEKKKATSLDEDLKIAIDYLNSYWSVGEIRFILDLKNLGVKDPEKIIDTLWEKKYIEIDDLGVITATENLPKIFKKKYFADLFT